MGLPQSKTHIVNLALDELKQAPVVSIDPPVDDLEKMCARQYDPARQTVLRKTMPNFAYAQSVCSRLPDAPLFDYTDAYQLPNNYIRLVSIDGVDEEDFNTQYRISGRLIYMNNSNADSIDLRYIKDVEDITKWDAGFRECMVLQLAANLAFAITGKNSVAQRVEAKLTAAWPDMVTVDGQENPPRRIQRSRYLAARRRGLCQGTDDTWGPR